MRLRSLFVPFLVAALGSVLVGTTIAPEKKSYDSVSATIRVTNGYLQIGLDQQSGQLLELRDLTSGQDFVAADRVNGGIWELDLGPEARTRLLTPANAKSTTWEKIDGALGLQMTWTDFGFEGAPDLRVTASFRLHKDTPMSEWNIALEGLGKTRIERLRFPRILGIPHLDKGRLAVPKWMGELAKNPRHVLSRRREWSYPGMLSMQCVALYQDNGPGLYAACNDTAAFRKTFSMWADEDGILNYEMEHFPEQIGDPKGRYVPDYSAVIGTFVGDWFTAAEQYREWGSQQRWSRESRFHKGLLPQWLLETGMWVWNRGRSENALLPASVMQAELRLPVRVHWHWWHGCSYDAGFPEYLPPREGRESFLKALARAQGEGLRAIVYMNQRLWGMTTRSWTEQGAERFAVHGYDGRVVPEVYNKFTEQACASMCMGTSFWRNKYAGLADEAVNEYNVDGIYMDQACSTLPCYNSEHGHPLRGGNYWMDGFRTLVHDMRSRIDTCRQIILAGEGCGEAWLPHLDLFLTLQVSRERYADPDDGWEVIPFFQSVYHEYGVTYGNYSSLTLPPYDELWPLEFAPLEPMKLLDRKYSRQFMLEQARSFVWGMQPTVANFLPTHLQERRDEIDYIVRLARIRNQGIKYLLYGTFLRPPMLNVPDVDVDISRLSIYAGQQKRKASLQLKVLKTDGIDDSGDDEGKTSLQRRFPSAVVGAWRAQDGDVGIALASIVDIPLSVSFNVDPTAYGISSNGRIYRIDEKGRELLGTFGGETFLVSIDLSARGACILELIPKR